MFTTFITNKFIETAKNFPKRNAFCFDEEYCLYSEFLQRIVAICKALENNPEPSIGISYSDDLETYASIFAIWFSGKSYVPLNSSAPQERNQKIIDSLQLKTILDTKTTSKFSSSDFQSSIIWIENHVKSLRFPAEELAYIFFTSGSTGEPKGVKITKLNVASFVDAFYADDFVITENDRCLQMFDLTFDLSVMSFLVPLLNGACVFTIPPDKIKYSYIFELMDEKDITVSLMVPSILNYLKPYFDEIYCPKMRYSFFCGEALPLHIVEEWSKCLPNARIDNVYGPTENTIFCTYYNYSRTGENDSLNGILSIGKAMKNCILALFDETNNQVNRGETGELCLAGSQLTPGYLNNDTLNKGLFFEADYEGKSTRFYRSGDLCMQRKNGNYEFVGRKDTQVKVQGFRIELSEIEFHCNNGIQHEFLSLATTIKNTSGNNEVALIFESQEFDTSGIKNYLKSNLPSYMIPTQTFFIHPFPLNKNGKIDRKEINRIIKES